MPLRRHLLPLTTYFLGILWIRCAAHSDDDRLTRHAPRRDPSFRDLRYAGRYVLYAALPRPPHCVQQRSGHCRMVDVDHGAARTRVPVTNAAVRAPPAPDSSL